MCVVVVVEEEAPLNSRSGKIMDSIEQTFHSLLNGCIGFIACVEETHKQSHNKIPWFFLCLIFFFGILNKT